MAMVVVGLQLGGRAAGIIVGVGGGQAWSSRVCGVRGGMRLRTMQQQAGSEESTSSTTSFDAEGFDAERLKLDAQAREAMVEVAEESRGPGAWKWVIRKRIWDSMEATNVANEPRPVHHRIPNFKGAAEAAARLAKLPAFEAAKCVKVNPDSPQKPVRFLTLSGGKILLTPQPRLRTGFFSTLEAAANIPAGVQVIEACTSAGAAKYGEPVGLDSDLKVDLIVIGSVAVDPTTGARLGKGEGFAELEYAMLRYMGAIDDKTLVGTSVHDIQVVEEGLIPTEKLLIHDVPVDVICTPTRTIFTNGSIPKPQGIYWEKLSPEKLGQIRILQILKKSIEEKTGKPLPTGPSEKLPPTAKRTQKVWKKSNRQFGNRK